MGQAWTLADHWRQHACCKPDDDAVVHWVAGEEPFRWRWGTLVQAAEAFGAKLRDAGVRRGDTCALILHHHRDFYPLYLGVSLIGALPAVLAYPNPRLHPAKFRAGLAGMARRSGLDWVLTSPSLEAVLSDLVFGDGSSIQGVLFPLEASRTECRGAQRFDPPAVSMDDACLLQHSSGTTGLQKAVVLSHRAVIEHAERYGKALRLHSSDRIASWLPLYHDMGLIAAFHLPLIAGIPTIQLDPFEWVAAPSQLLQAVSREQATLTWLPNFAYNFLADRVRDEELEGVRLDSLRMVINCSEPVRADSHAKFFARFGNNGLRREALAASYAMAEATFAVTQTPPGTPAPEVRAARDELSRGLLRTAAGDETARVCVSSGAPIDGCEVRVVDAEGVTLPDGHVGELVVRSVSLFDGYRNNPEETRRALRDGWYWTGDYGVLCDGQCYVVGRKKDLIIVAGKNLYPEDLEDVVSGVDGVVPGRVIAFGQEDARSGTERACIVAETTATAADEQDRIRWAIVRAAMSIDVTVGIHDVHLRPPRWLIKSSSGKPSRAANRARLQEHYTWSQTN